MNYISNPSIGLCCGLGESDRIEIEESCTLVDCETGKDMAPFSCGLIPGRTYRYEKRWVIKQSWNIIKTFDSREAAQSAYDDLVKRLAASNTVIEIS